MFSAIDDREAIAEKTHSRLVQSAIIGGACPLLVCKLVCFCESRTLAPRLRKHVPHAR
jgi:hypothetical protein